MGDISAEPSMEDILSSIKRIIAEEGEGTPMRNRRPPRAAAPAPAPVPPANLRGIEPADDDEEVLELSDPMPLADPELDTPVRMNRPQSAPTASVAASPAPLPPVTPASATPASAPPPSASLPPASPAPEPGPVAAVEDEAEPILSQHAAAASRGALDTLSKLLMKPEPNTDGTLEGLVREMLRPMLRDWLDANLPELVETLVAREIGKITATAR